MNIYVGNLDFRVDEDDLREVFEECGAVESVKIIMDKFSGRSKGFGFVTMTDQSEALKALKEFDGCTYENRQMVVNEAKQKKPSYNNF